MATYLNLSDEDKEALYKVEEVLYYLHSFHRGATLKPKNHSDITPEQLRTTADVINSLLCSIEIEVVK